MTALIFTGDVEDKLQRLQWIPRLSTWRPFRFCDWPGVMFLSLWLQTLPLLVFGARDWCNSNERQTLLWNIKGFFRGTSQRIGPDWAAGHLLRPREGDEDQASVISVWGHHYVGQPGIHNPLDRHAPLASRWNVGGVLFLFISFHWPEKHESRGMALQYWD